MIIAAVAAMTAVTPAIAVAMAAVAMAAVVEVAVTAVVLAVAAATAVAVLAVVARRAVGEVVACVKNWSDALRVVSVPTAAVIPNLTTTTQVRLRARSPIRTTRSAVRATSFATIHLRSVPINFGAVLNEKSSA